MSSVKISRTGQVAIPADIRGELGLNEGDYVEITREGSRIVLTPVAPRHPEIDAALAEGLADEHAGRLSPPFKSMKEFRAWLKTEQGREFGKG